MNILERERYSRHLLLPQIGEQGQEKLAAARVLIVGAGGLGSPIALYLTAAGVGTIGLVDADVVSVSNLQRQVLYDTSVVGEPKVEAAYSRLKGLSPHTEVVTYREWLTLENAADIIKDYDLVVDACDSFITRYVMNDCCAALKVPYLYGSIGAFKGQVCLFDFKSDKSYRDLYPDEDEMKSLELNKGVMGVEIGRASCRERVSAPV